MKIKKIEEALKEIREREDYLTRLRWGKKIDFYHYVPKLDGDSFKPLTLNAKEKSFLKASCITEIKKLKKSIECLTD